MHNFVSILECVNTGGGPCATSLPSLLLYAVVAALALSGWRAGRRDVAEFRATLRRGLKIGGATTLLSSVAIAGFFLFDPDPILGIEDHAGVNVLWIAAISAFGLGATLLVGMIGFWLGGCASRLGQPSS